MDVREIDPTAQDLVRRHWEIRAAAEDASRPFDFSPPWASFWAAISQGRDDVETVLLGAFEADGTMAGAARVDLSTYDNLHSVFATTFVHPDRLRRGLGRGLVDAVCDLTRARGRRLVQSEAYAPMDQPSPGLLFAAATGFATALEEAMKVVDLVETEPRWAALEQATAERHEGYRVVVWRDGVPDDLVDGVCRLNEMFFDEMPKGELEVEPERWDASRLRLREEANARQGRLEAAGAALAPDGTVVALTEIALDANAPGRGWQSGTLVDPTHRGHGLGIAIKLANQRQVREHFPLCRLLQTGNAGVNAPMNAVNSALGYRDVERCVELQREV